jgi:phosphatidate phosphatase APP1
VTDWQRVLAPLANDVENIFDNLKQRLETHLGGPSPMKIVPYRGYGTPVRLFVKGRVLKEKGKDLLGENDTVWDNLVHTYRRLATHEVPYAQVKVRFQGQEQQVTADEEGFFDAWIEPAKPVDQSQPWQTVQLELASPVSKHQEGLVQATTQVLVPPESARYVVISDIDDTVIQTGATSLLHMARTVFLSNARTRLPFPGVAALLRALYQGPEGNNHDPLFYVSSSPWNLYDLLSDFFNLQGIPDGPVLFLRDWGLTHDEILPLHNRDYKLRTIREIISLYSHLPYILIGDSGQEDPEIYTEIASEYPHRVLAVYVRNVSRDLARPKAIQALAERVVQAGSTLILADNTLALAQHAAEQGWIDPSTLEGIRTEKKVDEGPPTPVEKLLGQVDKPAAPTVVLHGNEGSAQAATKSDEPTSQPVNEALQAGKGQTKKPPTVVLQPAAGQGSQNKPKRRKSKRKTT